MINYDDFQSSQKLFSGIPALTICIQEERVVGNDNCVRYQGRIMQLPKARHRCHFVKAHIRVHSYPDGRYAVFHGPRKLACYDLRRKLIEKEGEIKELAA